MKQDEVVLLFVVRHEYKGKHYIIVDEVPYGINTLDLKNKVADLVHNKVIDGIADYHTDLKDGIKITITLKKDANPQVVLNNLYKHTAFQNNFGIIFLMLDQGVPKTLGLKDIISKYVDYQKEIIIRRTKFDLAKDEARAHILEGLKIALDHIDAIIALIKASKSDEEAMNGLMSKYHLSEAQSQAILEMKLRRLTGLERDKIENELAALLAEIEELKSILASEEKVLQIIKDEMTEIKNKYGDERRTDIDMTAIEYIEDESLIPVEDIIVTLTNNGYVKRLKSDTYRAQNRGGVGVKGMATNEEDFVKHLINMKTHDYILFFSNKGRVYRLKGYEGLPIINLLSLDKNENISSIVKVAAESEENNFLLFTTKNGLVKRTAMEEFDSIRRGGKIAIILKDDDELINVSKTNGENEVVLGASNGRMVRFNEQEVRVMGRGTSGVRGMDLDGSHIVGAEVVTPEQLILIVTENGYGKQTEINEYRLTHRGSKGVKALNVTEKNGSMVALNCVDVTKEQDLIIVSDSGIVMRMPLEQVSTLRRATQGVRLIHLKDNQRVATVTIVEKEKSEDITEEEKVEN